MSLSKLLKRAKTAFSPPRPPANPLSDKSKERAAKFAVRETATGNIRLQRGEYDTRADVDRRYERIKSHKFDD